MALVDDDDHQGYPARPAPRRIQGLVNAAGAIASLALLAGVGVWGYRLAVRDVSGIPVVRALEGPMRIAPTEPGGAVAAHTGLAVNGVAADGAAAPLPDQIVLAPRPAELAPEDQPVPGPAPVPAAIGPDGATVATPADGRVDPLIPLIAPGRSRSPQADPQTEPPTDPSLAATEVPPVALAEAEGATPVPAAADAAMDRAVETALAEALGAAPLPPAALASARVAPDGAVLRSPRPERRPEGDRPGDAAPTPVALTAPGAPVAGGEVDVTSIAAGTRMVQLGAFNDAATARGEWARLQAQFGELIAPKAMVLQTAQSGGRTFVRLRALGFDDEADARRFCSALLAENASCIPVAHRP